MPLSPPHDVKFLDRFLAVNAFITANSYGDLTNSPLIVKQKIAPILKKNGHFGKKK
jgi:hypothetical protein